MRHRKICFVVIFSVVAMLVSSVCWAQSATRRSRPAVRPSVPLSTGSPYARNRDLQRIRNSASAPRAPTINRVSNSILRSPGRSVSSVASNRRKPFSGVQKSPTLSPYLGLLRDTENDTDLPAYFAFVRPRQEQERINRQQNRDMQQLNRQVQQLDRRIINPSGAQTMRPTGHQTLFMNLSHYYGGQ